MDTAPESAPAQEESVFNNKRLFGVLPLVAALLCVGVTAAHAQQRTEDTPEIAKNWNLRLGIFVYNNKAASDKAGAVGISGLVERTVYNAPSYEVTVGGGYNGFDTVYSVPITVNLIGKNRGARYGVAGGFAFGKRPDGSSSQGSVLGLILGYESRWGASPVSFDMRYNFISGADNQLDGFSLTAGMRF